MRAGGKHRQKTGGLTTRTRKGTSPGTEAGEELGEVEELHSRGEKIIIPEGRHEKHDEELRDKVVDIGQHRAPQTSSPRLRASPTPAGRL